MRKAVFGPLVMLSIVLYGCGPSPEDVGKQFQDALNSGDIDTALELLDDEAVVDVDGTRAGTGKAEIEEWLELQSDLNYRVEGEPVVSGSAVMFDGCTLSSDLWRYLRTNPISGTCEMRLEGGLISSFTISFDEGSKTLLAESPPSRSTDIAAIWTASGVIPSDDPSYPEADRSATFYLQFDEDGTARLALSPEGLLTDPNSEYPGVSLSWTYEDYVLTVMNLGAASEGYCQEQDLGRYMVRNVEDGGIQFKPIEDTCLWRKTALQRFTGLPWDPYVP